MCLYLVMKLVRYRVYYALGFEQIGSKELQLFGREEAQGSAHFTEIFCLFS